MKKRNEIRLTDVPEKLFKSIVKNAKKNNRTQGKEVITFLEQNNYDTNK